MVQFTSVLEGLSQENCKNSLGQINALLTENVRLSLYPLIIKSSSGQVVVVVVFNPSIWEAEAGESLNLRSAWSTD